MVKDQERETDVPPPIPDSFAEPDVYTRFGRLRETQLAGANPGSEVRSILGFVFLDANNTLVATGVFNHLELLPWYLRNVDESPTRAMPFKAGVFGPIELPGGGGFATRVSKKGYDFSEEHLVLSADAAPPLGLYEAAYTARAVEFSADRTLKYFHRPNEDASIRTELYAMTDLYQELAFADHDPGSLRN